MQREVSYLIFPMNEYLFLRISYLFIDGDYNGGFFGPNPDFFGTTAPEVDTRIHSLQVVLNAQM